MKKLPLTLVLLAGVTILPPAQLSAQDLAIVYTLTPKSGNGPAVRAALADYTDWLRQQNDDWGWGVFQVVQGENVGDWILRSGGHDWGDLDERYDDLGPRAVQRFQSNVLPLLESLTSQTTRSDPALTNNPPDTGYRLFHLTSYRMADQAAFNEAIARALQAYEEAGHTYYASYDDVLVGPNQPVKTRVRWYKTWADFENAPNTVELMTDVYGENEAAEILQRLNEAIESTEDQVIRYFPEMAVPGM